MSDIREWLKRKDQNPDKHDPQDHDHADLERIWQATADMPRPPEPDIERHWRELSVAMAETHAKPSWSPGRFLTLTTTALCILMALWIFVAKDNDRIIRTKRGEHQQLELADGSKIRLNADSALRIYRDFDEAHRKVALEGEAYFEVKPSQQAFVVEVADLEVTVLGTQFNIRSREYGVEIGVYSGVIEVQTDQNNFLTLKAGQHMFCPTNGPPEAIAMLADEHGPPWLQGGLRLQDTALVDVCLELERRYDVRILIQDASIQNKRVSGWLDGQDARTVMQSLCYLTETQLVESENQFVITL